MDFITPFRVMTIEVINWSMSFLSALFNLRFDFFSFLIQFESLWSFLGRATWRFTMKSPFSSIASIWNNHRSLEWPVRLFSPLVKVLIVSFSAVNQAYVSKFLRGDLFDLSENGRMAICRWYIRYRKIVQSIGRCQQWDSSHRLFIRPLVISMKIEIVKLE